MINIKAIAAAGGLVVMGAGLVHYSPQTEGIKDGVTELKKYAIEYKTQAQDLLTSNQSLVNDLDDLKAKRDGIIEELDRQYALRNQDEETISKLKGQLADVENKAKELFDKIVESTNNLGLVSKEKEELEGKLEKVQEDRNTIFQKLNEELQRNELDEKAVNALRAEIEKSNTEIKGYQDQLKECNDKINNMEIKYIAEIGEKDKEIKRLNSEIVKVEKELELSMVNEDKANEALAVEKAAHEQTKSKHNDEKTTHEQTKSKHNDEMNTVNKDQVDMLNHVQDALNEVK